MRRLGLLTAVLLLTVSVVALGQTARSKSSKAKAQDNGHMALLTNRSPIDLLNSEAVRKELELSDNQEATRKECKTKLDRLRQESKDARKQVDKDAPPGVRATFYQQQSAAFESRRKQLDAEMLKSLDSRQRTRLDQIGIQLEGPTAFRRPEFQARLNMDPGQIELIRGIIREGLEAANRAGQVPPEVMKKAFLPRDPNQPGNVRKIDPKYRDQYIAASNESAKVEHKVRATTMRQITKLLSRKQLQSYQALCGEPFDILAERLDPTPPQADKGNETKAP